MSLLDWTLYSVGSPDAEIDNSTQISGIGSLRQFGSNSMLEMVENNYMKGLTRGKIRDLIRVDTCSGGGNYDAGFFFMGSHVDLTSSGTCYTYSINMTSVSSNTKVSLQYHDNGIESSPTVLYSGPTFDRNDSGGPLIIALEVEWVYEPSLLNGILITMREGHDPSLIDFSNLSEISKVIIFQEEVFFLGSGASEGIYMDSRDSAGDLDIKRDKTIIYDLIPV